MHACLSASSGARATENTSFIHSFFVATACLQATLTRLPGPLHGASGGDDPLREQKFSAYVSGWSKSGGVTTAKAVGESHILNCF